MHFILVNLIIILAYYLFVNKLKITGFSCKLVVIGLLSLAQIIMSQLVLGILGLLYLWVLIALNLIISGIIIGFSLRGADVRYDFSQDVQILKTNARSILVWENITLIVLALIVSVWMFLASYFFPPRSIDDMVYHLPPVYEYIINHKIDVLPVELRNMFAFPENAELIFMWPAIFFNNQKWVDMTQYIIAIFAVIVIYALARLLKCKTKDSFFISILFLFTPVVLMQCGTSFIDVITNTFMLAGIYLSIKFYIDEKPKTLYLAAVSVGLMSGMKYGILMFTLVLQGIIISKLIKKRRRELILYLFIMLLFCGYWYIRNLIVFQNILYPVNVFKNGMDILSAEAPKTMMQNSQAFLTKIYLLYIKDAGLGSFNGGFGLVYWGIAFPSWIYLLVKTFRRWLKEKGIEFLVYIQGVIGIASLLLVPLTDLPRSSRYMLFVVAIGLLSVGNIFSRFKMRPLFNYTIKCMCIIFSVLSFGLLSSSTFPHFRIDKAIDDFTSGRKPSEYKYYQYSGWFLPSMRYVAEPLDYLTRGDKKGFSCYMAADWTSFWVTNIYGSNLQNRVWNFEKKPAKEPDVCIFQYFEDKNLMYIGKKIEPLDVALNPEYVLIIQTNDVQLFIKKETIEKPDKKALLKKYYKETFPYIFDSVNTENIGSVLEKGIPIITTNLLGYIMRYSQLDNTIGNEVYWIPEEFQEMLIAKYDWITFYTVGYPFESENFYSESVCSFKYEKTEEIIYKNTNNRAIVQR